MEASAQFRARFMVELSCKCEEKQELGASPHVETTFFEVH